MSFNAVTGANYGYLNRKPAVGTLLDWFGPWPGYVVVEIALVAAIWALMTWPWTRTADPRDADAPPPGQARAARASSLSRKATRKGAGS